MDYTFFIPAADFTFETFDEVASNTEIVAEEAFGVDAIDYLGVDGEIHQYFSAGFETNPEDETFNDNLGFQFEVEGPKSAFKTGSVIYQWATYAKSDDFTTNPTSIGCVTKYGDPYVSEVQTFSGTTSMGSNST